MKSVLIIGNNFGGKIANDGGSIKIALYKECLEQNGYETLIVDLYQWKRHAIKSIFLINRYIKKCDVILIMGGPNGSRVLIPLVNFLNKSKKKRTVYCPLGIGVFEKLIDKLDPEQVNSFINCKNFFGIKDPKIKKALERINCIIPQNEVLTNLYKKFYSLNNVHTLLNFRNVDIKKREYYQHSPFKIIYLSRIARNKGIFLLLEVISQMKNIELNIYGDIQLNKDDFSTFNEYLSKNNNIKYCGICNVKDSINILYEHDLLCLPTKYIGEGTPGVYIESIIAGTPVLLSAYSQAKELIDDGFNGFICKVNDCLSLKEKILSIMNSDLKKVSFHSQEKARQFLFSRNKKEFFTYIIGEDLMYE